MITPNPHAETTNAQTRGERRFLVFVTAAAFALRVFHIGAQSLWIDELLTIQVSRSTPVATIWELLVHNVHGPLHSFVVYLFGLVGRHDWWLRMPSAIAGAAAVALFYVWIRDWIGHRIAAFGAVLLAINPLHVHYSQEARNYAFLLMFAMAACVFFERLMRSPSRRTAAMYVVTLACAALSNFSAAFLYAAHTAIYFGRSGFSRGTLRRWVLTSVCVLALISPWVYRISEYIDVGDLVTPVMPGELQPDDRLRGETTFHAGALPYAAYTYAVGFTLGPSLRELHASSGMGAVISRHAPVVAWVALLFGTIWAVGLAGAIRRRLPWRSLAAYAVIPLGGVLILNWQNAKAFNVRYVLIALPACLAFAAIGVASLPRVGRWIALGLVGATTAASLGNLYFNGDYAREDVRSAVRYIEEREGASECIMAPNVYHVARHYYKGTATFHEYYQRGVPESSIRSQLSPVFAGCNSLWYIRARAWYDDPDGALLERLRREYGEVERVEFDGVELYGFTREKKNDS